MSKKLLENIDLQRGCSFYELQDEKIINCSEFEENLTDYLDKTLDKTTHKAVAAHALRCPLCHSLLNEVKDALDVCHEISAPKHAMTHLEARILSMTAPETAMSCEKFEEYLTDYLDGFLPAPLFHRWERHAVLCEKCTDLPGEVVRSIAACYTYKMEELPIPTGCTKEFCRRRIGTTEAQNVKANLGFADTGMDARTEFPDCRAAACAGRHDASAGRVLVCQPDGFG